MKYEVTVPAVEVRQAVAEMMTRQGWKVAPADVTLIGKGGGTVEVEAFVRLDPGPERPEHDVK